ncbi:MAG: glycosyltransferase [Bacteroidales bacterium]|nr:glycosyltransferase [Bacteroidales bacterium]
MLLPGLAKEVELIVLGLQAGVEKPSVVDDDGFKEYFFPNFTDDNGGWRANGDKIFDMLIDVLPDSHGNIFLINHSPCAQFIDELKKRFPKSKTVFVIHDQGWCGHLLGSRKFLKQIMVDGTVPRQVPEETATYVKEYCDKELEIYRRVDAIVALSETCRSTLIGIYGVPADKIHVIPNGYNSTEGRRPTKSQARKRLGISDDEEIIVYAGRTVRHKGIEPLLMAIARLRKNHPRLRCVMCGSLSGFAKYGKLIEPVAASLILTGFIPSKNLRYWYAAADVGIMPSYSEPFGYSGIEMADAGLPVVVSDGNCLTDIYNDGVNGFVASIGPDVTRTSHFVQSLTAKVEEALDCTPKKRKKIISESRERIRNMYSAERMSATYLSLFQHLIVK